jgi:hypothetical protein
VGETISTLGVARSKRPSLARTLGSYTFRSFRSGFVDASEGESNESLRVRDVAITIAREELMVGAAKLRQWRLPAMTDPRHFWYHADHLSQIDADFAEMVNSHWSTEDFPSNYGDMILFDRLAIDSASDAKRRALRLLGEYLLIEFGNRLAVMLLKAFPLEYENSLDSAHADRRDSFHRRQKAMQRLYRSALGVERFASPAGDSGWMWRGFDGCPAPSEAINDDWRY